MGYGTIKNMNPVKFFKALGDETRFEIIILLAKKPCATNELASIFGYKPPTITQHINVLKSLDLIAGKHNGVLHMYRLANWPEKIISRKWLESQPTPNYTRWREKILARHVTNNYISSWPVAHMAQQVILEWLVVKMPPKILGLHNLQTEITKYHANWRWVYDTLVAREMLEVAGDIYAFVNRT